MPNSISLLPQRPDDFYRYLLNKCLEHDLQNSGEELTLSKLSNQVLSECALRWRLPRHFRELAKLDIVVRNYINKTIPIDDVFPTFKVVRKLAEDSRSFRKVDTSYYVSILDSLQAVLHKYLVHFADQLNHPSTAMYSNTTMQLSTHILSEIWTDRAWSESNPSKMGKLEDQIREELLEAMTARYQLLNNRVYTARVEREIQKMTLLVKAINIEVNKYQQHYPDPILGSIYLKPIAAETCLKYFILEMENLRYGSLMGDYEIREILELYQVVRLLYDMCEETQLAIVKDFDVESWFAPFIRQWLNLTDQKWLEWVDSAVMQEKYTPTLPPKSMFSTSVFDIFQCFHTGLDFIEKLRWRESGKKEKLIRDFIKMMSKALQRYTQLMFEEFEQIENENSDKATEFTYQSCIKLNNLLAAHHKLRDILDKLGVSRNGRIDPDAPRRDMPGDDPELAHSWLFHIKVIRAQNLMACDWTTSDPYVVLKHSGMELARTRVIEKNLNPAWNETFTVALPDSLPENESFLELFVYDKDIIGSDDLCGNASLFMRDRQFEDYLSHDVELTLKPQGKVFVRVTRQGEIDDNDFWVRKAEETVTFALEDMIRIYIDQIGRVARPIIQKVMNQSGSGAISSLFSSFASLTGGSGGSSTTLTDEQVENLIQPILEYLDLNLGLFNEALDPGLSEFLIERYPWLQASQRSGDKDATASGDAAAGAAEATKDAMMASNGNAMSGATPGAPNFVTKMVWQELLKLIHVYLLSFGGSSKEKAKKQRAQNGGANPTTTGDDLPPVTLSESEKRHTVVLDLIVEYLKTLFHCEVDGEHMGFAVEELEDTRYWEVRRTLKHFLVATKA
ncbi:hypothetical protein HK102_001525 [Quaeritorhiza haematococci]|nr:hypothetical protein HK102_001525 [Quaeritorhiza haematococci]